jgi:hypothetical protein
LNLYVDCEFDGFGGPLMSMALVSDAGHEWYEVLPVKAVTPWVIDNVVPVLNKAPVSPEEFRLSLHSFLRQFDRPTVFADWHTDLVHFFKAFGGRNHSESIMYPCRAELVPIEYHSATPHNALADARAIREALQAFA